MITFKIYGKNDCMYCTLAIELLEMLNQSYVYLVLDEDYSLEEYKDMFPTSKTVPQVIANGTKIGGYQELREFLGTGL